MRTSLVITNETCDQRCGFCNVRREHERASVAGGRAISGALDRVGEGTTVVLTGGEPTLRRDLEQIVAAARARGVAVELETHACGIDEARARSLASAGLVLARVHVPSIERYGQITGDPRGLPALRRGVAALARAGITIEASIPIVAENLGELERLPAAIQRELPMLKRARVRIPTDGPRGVAAIADAIVGLVTLAEGARARGLELWLDPASGIAPCLVPRPDRVGSLFSLGPGGNQRDGFEPIAACQRCVLVDRCPGVAEQVREHAEARAQPITDDRLRRRLSRVGAISEQVARELVTHEVYRRSDGSTIPAAIVRIGFTCNQACRFCFVSTHLPAPERSAVERAIAEIGGRRGVLVLSGGEPTLDPELAHWIAEGKRRGAAEVELQTNATRIDAARAAELMVAGLDTAFVSLHGATAVTSDAITDAPGTFGATVSGLDALVAVGARVRINFVICKANHHELPAFVDLVAARWPAAAITLSFVAPSTDLVPSTPDLVPRYHDVLPDVTEAVARASAHGVELGGFDSMCGIPLCLVPHSLAPFFALAELERGADAGEFVKPAECGRCVLERRCFGIRRRYAQLYGTNELRAVTSVDEDRTPPAPRSIKRDL